MTWLIDKSALVRLGDSPDAELWAQRIERGLVRITTVTRLEVGYSPDFHRCSWVVRYRCRSGLGR